MAEGNCGISFYLTLMHLVCFLLVEMATGSDTYFTGSDTY